MTEILRVGMKRNFFDFYITFNDGTVVDLTNATTYHNQNDWLVVEWDRGNEIRKFNLNQIRDYIVRCHTKVV